MQFMIPSQGFTLLRGATLCEQISMIASDLVVVYSLILRVAVYLTTRRHLLVHALVRIRLRVDLALVDVDAQEYRHGGPDDYDEEEKGMAGIIGAASDETDDERADDDRSRLSRER